MRRHLPADPRRGLPTAEERRKTTEPLTKTSDHTTSERKTIKRAVNDLDSGNQRNAKSRKPKKTAASYRPN
jgi:hypothetical protein